MNVDKIRFHHLPKETFQVPIERTNSPVYFTYVAYDYYSELTKIGRSTHPFDRIRSLEAKLKRRLKPIIVVCGDYESRLHETFAKQRSSYEWFYLSKEQLKNLQNGAFSR